MKNYLLLCTALALSVSGFSQSVYPPMIWTSTIGSAPSDPEDLGIEWYDITVEPISGDVYVLANCFAPCLIAPGIIVVPETDEMSTVLVKYDASGLFKWANDLGYLGIDYQGAHICSGAQDGVYITAPFTVDEVDFGNGVKATRSCSSSCEEMFVAKIGSNGLATWARTITGSSTGNSFFAAGIEVDQTGTLFVAGNYIGPKLDFGGNFQYNNLPTSGFFLARYEAASGTPQNVFFASPSSSGTPFISHLAVNDDNQMILAGEFEGTLAFDNGLSITAPNAGNGYYIAGLSTDGSAQWVRQISSQGGYFDVLGIDIDAQGNAYLAIDVDTELKLDNSTIATVTTLYAGVVLKLGSSAFSLPVYIGYNTDDYAVMDVKLDLWGNIYTSGYTSAPLDVAGIDVGMDGCVDALLTATSSEGLIQWARTVGGPGCEAITNNAYASSLAFDQVGFMYGVGLFFDGFNEDGYIAPGTGGFIAKFNTSIVGTKEPNQLVDLQIQPNPSPGVFSITLPEIPEANARLAVYDLSGREVFGQEISQAQTEIRTGLPEGAYIVVVRNGDTLGRQKLLIQP